MIALKPSAPGKSNLAATFLPVLLTSGPLFTCIGLTGLSNIPRSQNPLYLFDQPFALAGVMA